ncbi:hypothetical protein HXX76_010069 [Chlamydomonas incerta]|uniref:Uncharacterized protein n=1 Tax=Chlamydomonas incerta TaxID=51695 RepID=A0A835SYH1_CHLIN|nr:hypothetical protein HXX76_010069 [Chlamydomonas incerta]|eukprot:KAG2430549.1 hypothetical protein HXX76_010069 [Chlamydomonas incerta]
MSNRPCILHTRRYRAVYEGLVNTLRESQALQPQQLAQLKELQAGLCSCIAQELLLPDAGDAAASSACFPAAAPAAEGPPAAQQPGSSSALQGAQAQLLHLAQRQGADAEAVMATAARHLGSVVVRVAQTSEQQLVRKKEARRAARDAEDWMYAVATPVVKRRGGARRGGPFGRPVAGRLTSTCMGEQPEVDSVPGSDPLASGAGPCTACNTDVGPPHY